MANDLNPSKRAKRKVKLSVRLTIPMLLMVLLQIVTFFASLFAGGEFRYVRQYAYKTFEEKTENRRDYIEAELLEKVPYVQEYSTRIDSLVMQILEEEGASVADLQTDRSLSRTIMTRSVDTMVSFLRRGMVNDVYLILETGDLYKDEGGSPAKAALYLRDLDVKTDAGYEDLLMEVGFTSISQDYGIMLDTGWSLYFASDPEDAENSDFYYRTLKTAQENTALARENLGFWSGFSKPTRVAAASMKYSLPLIAEDGTVYGVIGVGLTENTFLSNLPANDFLSETACYVLGRDNSDNDFDIVTHSGASYVRLVGNAETLPVSEMLEENICDFSLPTDVQLAGSVQYIGLYDQNSPYYSERWALISVADRASILSPLSFLIRMLLTAATFSLLVGIVIVVLSCHEVVKPISGAIKVMNAERKYNEVIQFQPSNIFEIDRMTDAITQLQINVRDFSSQVSKMIRIADVGLGTFMYDRTDDSVFVSQSLLGLLCGQEQQEDIVMSRREFLESIRNPEMRAPIAAGLGMSGDGVGNDLDRVYQISRLDGAALWLRMGFTYSHHTAIGIVQDITETVMERNRIEHERDHDNLTGLLNRQAYYRMIEELFLDRSKLNITAFIMVDLDNLKHVNDTYGHDFGDSYIKTAATVLKKFQNHGGIVARLSGDEFNICLPGFSSKEEVREIIHRVRAELLQSSCLLPDGTRYKVGACLGVAWYPDDAESRELLMKYADYAMYTVKHSTKGDMAEFDINGYLAHSANLIDAEELNRVIEGVKVQYAFQSIVSVKSGEVYGYEALMRVQSNIFRSSQELLNAAKAGDRLREIERMTWRKSLADFQAQVDAGRINKTAHIFVNSIANLTLEESVVAELEHAYPQLLDRIVIEILESESADEDSIIQKKQVMQRWNGSLALDDYGTGYNSEYALLRVEPNIIKIDRSIINGCDRDTYRCVIIENLVKVAHAKGILVLAEGVESEEEVKTVISCGVDFLQGYYLAHPSFEPAPIAPEITETIRRMAAREFAVESRS